ncbi:helix-turn-helix domain-containing protein [Halostella sp. PRR32]|uniref:TrmB family transcriptional regulator n=1 Tax=Halostella sp. PRR32 TaxID=3098147 RepID=UPI002B1D8403|nr:helix-turn-helix domain-containing protein [Halostella sp. PRR32]
MTSDDDAVTALESVGLTEYEARCFVGLSRIRKGTAKEISQLSDVPRSRVYDALERLHERGLVDVQQSEPREYQAVETETALSVFDRDFRTTLDEVDEALGNVDTDRRLEKQGVWAIANRDHVIDRTETLLDDAETEVYLLVGHEAGVDEEVFDKIDELARNDVDVLVEVPSESAKKQVLDVIPAATVSVYESLDVMPPEQGHKPSHIVMVDRNAILLSAAREGDLPGVTEQTGIWCRGVDHGLLVWIRGLLTARIDDSDAFDYRGEIGLTSDEDAARTEDGSDGG